MSSTATRDTVSSEPVQWVQQQRHLWAGRAGGRPIGTIEAGRRYTYVDVDGVPHGGFRTLQAAQLASGRGSSVRVDDATPEPGADRSSSRRERLLLGASTTAAFSTVTLMAAAAPLLR